MLVAFSRRGNAGFAAHHLSKRCQPLQFFVQLIYPMVIAAIFVAGGPTIAKFVVWL